MQSLLVEYKKYTFVARDWDEIVSLFPESFHRYTDRALLDSVIPFDRDVATILTGPMALQILQQAFESARLRLSLAEAQRIDEILIGLSNSGLRKEYSKVMVQDALILPSDVGR